MKASILCVAGAGSALAASAALADNLLLNPSFEDVVVPEHGFVTFGPGNPIGPGWRVGAAISVVDVIKDNFSNQWPTPSDGRQFLYLGDGPSPAMVYQDVTLSAATSYSLKFDLAALAQQAYPGRAVVDILFGGMSILPGGAVAFDSTLGVFATRSLNFSSLNAGTYRVEVSNPSYAFGTNVDNFQLSTLAVPLPGAAGMGCTGIALGAIACAIRRRRVTLR